MKSIFLIMATLWSPQFSAAEFQAARPGVEANCLGQENSCRALGFQNSSSVVTCCDMINYHKFSPSELAPCARWSWNTFTTMRAQICMEELRQAKEGNRFRQR